MSIRHIARLGVVTVVLLGMTAAMAGCGPEAVKETAPPPITQNDATKDRIKSIQEAGQSKVSPDADKAAEKAKEGGK